MNFRTIKALTTRYILLYTRHPVRTIELFFWPIVQLCVWGFVTKYLQSAQVGSVPTFVTFMIAGIMLWDALFRAQQGVAISFLEDVWTRNLLNVFAAPVRMSEYLISTFAVGFLRVLITGLVMGVIAIFAYQFNIFSFSWELVGFYMNLLIFGWALGVVATSLIMRYGHGAEALAWAIPFMFQPIAAVFYPVSALPSWLQKVSYAFPTAHIFEGMRHSLQTGHVHWQHFFAATGLNIVYLSVAGFIFLRVLIAAREKGLLVKVQSS